MPRPSTTIAVRAPASQACHRPSAPYARPLGTEVKVLFFSPHSAIWVHAFPEALVAEALAQQGNEIVYVGCGGLLKSHCIPMAAAAIPFDAPPSTKQRLCRLCGDYKGFA